MGDEKFIVVRYTAEENVQSDAQAMLKHVESGNEQSAYYVPEMRSFCFSVEENGLYEIQMKNGGTVTTPRYLPVMKDTIHYMVCIVSVD